MVPSRSGKGPGSHNTIPLQQTSFQGKSSLCVASEWSHKPKSMTLNLANTRQATPFERVTSGGSQHAYRNALADVLSGLSLWQLWGRLGWNDILSRYRRSILGPFWLTLSTAIMVIALGFL